MAARGSQRKKRSLPPRAPQPKGPEPKRGPAPMEQSPLREREQRAGLDIVVDIHGMRAHAAHRYLLDVLRRAAADPDAKLVIVVHGYRGGTALRDMVRERLQSPFIERKHPGMTDGQTVLLLRKREARGEK